MHKFAVLVFFVLYSPSLFFLIIFFLSCNVSDVFHVYIDRTCNEVETREKEMADTIIDLIQGLREQNPKAQRQTLERYGNDVFAQVARMLPAAEDAEEVYQDVFVKVFKNIRTYDEQKSSLKTWISRIAYNEAVTWLRHKHPTMIYFEDREGSAEKLSDADVEETLGHANSETVQLIRAALKHLPPDERAVITMFYYEEMSLKEIAFVTESIPTTVASKLSRTRKKICKIIKMLQS